MLLSLLSRRSLEVDSRDAYGFALRPQHLQRYRECCEIYKEYNNTLLTEITREEAESVPGRGGEGNVSSSKKSVSDGSTESDQQKEVLVAKETKAGKMTVGMNPWKQVLLLMGSHQNLSFLGKRTSVPCSWGTAKGSQGRGAVDTIELVWQAFVGARKRRMERYYQNLIASETNAGEGKDYGSSLSVNGSKQPNADHAIPEKWRRQIEKDLPRTFPGHPALDKVGRDSLRHLLLAHAQHNPSVGYCQVTRVPRVSNFFFS
ncbi:hypothetical protein CK203_085991 [Vitis vinifera]|uniref:Rab-GAP TBC domain-containing protein n=1 Tax=Vitis vinifera TaxID=29760 RepID=A0A438DW53_VITVI|nr:hypothetical protein CK203_085991 [Vitis vinifera]